ncbi:ABC transporter ATP-binding protein [Microbacterium sp. CFBP 8790]|uniref:ABC transporter ATP-binding protein n=1 Tax=unclassified Microbacterium TaxID=2609290 RepID=UPI001782FE07|nr:MULTISPECIES: ABC transporter ATP-binding protein [unclassified Microbacterium]MBD8206373.1 ABC transporter ATP-binding protein [Microbacterium sp. CFBP 8801]MBD8508431.1 ABC transporter ATP-binding protein [Microbacterium sp. CFBP 8790]
MEAGIEVAGVRRSFGSVQAVRQVTFTAAPGRVTGLVGPNGSGKTTLMLMLASLLRPDDGELRIGGIDPVADPAGVRRVLGWMPDSLGAWPSLTAREVLVASAQLYDLSRDAARSRADELLELVDLTALAAAPARVLSRGQKQRLALARALVHDPRVLLLDEPASGLDPQARIALRVLLRRLAAEGRTILMSSHVLSELEEVVDDAVFLVDGRTVAGDRIAAAATRVRVWRVRLATDSSRSVEAARGDIAAALGRSGGEIGLDRRDALVPFSDDAGAVAGLRALVGAGLPVVEFAPAVGDLEHAFLDLRSESAPPPSPPGAAAPGPTAPAEPDDRDDEGSRA